MIRHPTAAELTTAVAAFDEETAAPGDARHAFLARARRLRRRFPLSPLKKEEKNALPPPSGRLGLALLLLAYQLGGGAEAALNLERCRMKLANSFDHLPPTSTPATSKRQR